MRLVVGVEWCLSGLIFGIFFVNLCVLFLNYF